MSKKVTKQDAAAPAAVFQQKTIFLIEQPAAP